MPLGAETFSEALRWGAETYHALKCAAARQGPRHRPRRRGRLRPRPAQQPRGARLHRRGDRARPASRPAATSRSALDVAATEFFEDGVYHFEGKQLSAERADRVLRRARRRNYPLVIDRGPAARGRLGRLDRTSPPSSAPRCRSSATTCSSPTRSASRKGIDARRPPTRSWSRSTRSARSPRPSTPSPWPSAPATPRSSRTAPARPRTPRSPTSRSRPTAGQIKTGAPGPQRARRQVQPAAAHRRGARRRRGLRRPQRVPALQGLSSDTRERAQSSARARCRRRVCRRRASRATPRARPGAAHRDESPCSCRSTVPGHWLRSIRLSGFTRRSCWCSSCSPSSCSRRPRALSSSSGSRSPRCAAVGRSTKSAVDDLEGRGRALERPGLHRGPGARAARTTCIPGEYSYLVIDDGAGRDDRRRCSRSATRSRPPRSTGCAPCSSSVLTAGLTDATGRRARRAHAASADGDPAPQVSSDHPALRPADRRRHRDRLARSSAARPRRRRHRRALRVRQRRPWSRPRRGSTTARRSRRSTT